MHFKSKNKNFTLNKEAVDFVNIHFSKAKGMHSDADVLRYGSDQVTLLGVYIELGIGVGRTVNFIAALNPTKKIMGLIHLKVCRKVGKGRI